MSEALRTLPPLLRISAWTVAVVPVLPFKVQIALAAKACHADQDAPPSFEKRMSLAKPEP